MRHKIYMKQLKKEIIQSGSYSFKLWKMSIMRNSILIHWMIRNFGQKISFLGYQSVAWCLIRTQLIFTRKLNKLHLEQESSLMGWTFQMIKCSKDVHFLIPIHSDIE